MVENVITPNIVIAGVTKAGTTSLFTYLRDHPDICGSGIKEINHFLPVRFNEPKQPLKDYSRNYNHCGDERYRLEASPAYFLGGEKLAEEMYEALPDVRVILVLRNPVSRFVSYFKFKKNMLLLPKEMQIDEYFEICQTITSETLSLRGQQAYNGLISGIYSDHIDSWIKIYGEDLHITFFDDMIRDPREFTKVTCHWLDLDEQYYDDYDFVIENMGRSYSNPILQKWALKLNKYFESFFRKHIEIKRFLRKVYFLINSPRSSSADVRCDDVFLGQIKEYYLPHNEILKEKLLNAGVKNLPDWLLELE